METQNRSAPRHHAASDRPNRKTDKGPRDRRCDGPKLFFSVRRSRFSFPRIQNGGITVGARMDRERHDALDPSWTGELEALSELSEKQEGVEK